MYLCQLFKKMICSVTLAALTFVYIVRMEVLTDRRLRGRDRSERGRSNNKRTRPLPIPLSGTGTFTVVISTPVTGRTSV